MASNEKQTQSTNLTGQNRLYEIQSLQWENLLCTLNHIPQPQRQPKNYFMLRIAESAMLDCGLIFAAPKFNQTTQGSDHFNFSHLIGSTAAFKCLNYHKKSARKSINYYVFQR